MVDHPVKDDIEKVADHIYALNTSMTDADKAESYRAALSPLLEQAAQIITRARHEGLIVGFSIVLDQFGIMRVQRIKVTKPL